MLFNRLASNREENKREKTIPIINNMIIETNKKKKQVIEL